ncbi:MULTISPECIES: energy-coupling factor transporter ATPase [Paenibacillus]|uniref:energy-coupling factor transporter ATPase n=1 Tax=Paenibacillus TaxID=44249 RepID=UPI00096F2A53|nr:MULTISPECIES: energy-coupling factor transporter ATPase [Paenibacillus]MDH6425662.1 energy-coupling factor transport system ATP-binding protein [Paenibacillus sp. PastH-4]MDH6441682.1 energy-coupling factor transport system ATP-binding protein [Paenibacillus sp. PastF-4]MDH6529807.1 energy-coupling factor transport system ATP-binding protein [Paenibacillus sp. PastH-3]OME00798.1 energy-coupling factor transporter ATPase [Paenibacillus odorifer]OME27492.1 energy-coupling factor transporter A
MLTFDQVCFYYKKGQPLLEDISFTIDAGEFVAIVGANGSGKSTIAKLMDGLLLPRKGTVQFKSLDTAKPTDLAEIHQQIGFVFQNPEDQFITTTVMDEVLFGLENIRVPREEMRSRLDHALQAVHMEDYLEAMPHQLSGGQKQRVAIAAILAMRPQVIIFDEATSMLDPQGRQQVLSIMQELHRQGLTLIHITHHMEEVLAAERVLLLHQGRLEFDGDPLTFFESMPVADYQLQLPFAVRVHTLLHSAAPLTADWKGIIRSQWSTN